MSTLRLQIRQETLGPVTDIYITPVETYPPVDFLTEKADIEVLPPPTLPEGGTGGWMNVTGGFLVTFCTLGAIVSFGANEDIYSRDFLSQSTPSHISWIGSVRVFLMFALSFPVGRFLDEGYFHSMVLAGSLLAVISQFVLGAIQVQKYYQVFLAQGICGGLASGLLFLPAVSIISQHFSLKRPLATGIVSMGSFLGGTVQSVAINKLFAFHRDSNQFLVVAICLGVIYVVMLLVAVVLLGPKTRQMPKDSSFPETNFLKECLTDVPYIIATIGMLFVLFGLFFPYFYLQLFSTEKGVHTAVVDLVLVVLNASAVLGCLLFVIPAMHYGPLSVLAMCSLILAVLTMTMLLLKDGTNIMIFSALYGFFSGGFISLLTQLPLAFFQGDRGIGIRTGFWLFAVSVAVLIGPPILGMLVESPDFVWKRPIVTSGVSMFIGSFLLLSSRVLITVKERSWISEK